MRVGATEHGHEPGDAAREQPVVAGVGARDQHDPAADVDPRARRAHHRRGLDRVTGHEVRLRGHLLEAREVDLGRDLRREGDTLGDEVLLDALLDPAEQERTRIRETLAAPEQVLDAHVGEIVTAEPERRAEVGEGLERVREAPGEHELAVLAARDGAPYEAVEAVDVGREPEGVERGVDRRTLGGRPREPRPAPAGPGSAWSTSGRRYSSGAAAYRGDVMS